MFDRDFFKKIQKILDFHVLRLLTVGLRLCSNDQPNYRGDSGNAICSEKLKSTFFPYCPELPEQPIQKNSCSKMWLVDQLYIELGINPNESKIPRCYLGAGEKIEA